MTTGYLYDGGTGTFDSTYLPLGTAAVLERDGGALDAEFISCGSRVFVRSWSAMHGGNDKILRSEFHGEINFCSFSALRTFKLTCLGKQFAAGTYVYLLGEKY